MLTQAERLDTETLIQCAKTKNQEHLLAISRRKSLPESLTDVLVERGQQVVLSTAKKRWRQVFRQGLCNAGPALTRRRPAFRLCLRPP